VVEQLITINFIFQIFQVQQQYPALSASNFVLVIRRRNVV